MTRIGAGKDGRPFEREYDSTIVGMAHTFGWLASHHPDSRRLVGDKGLPDWTLLHPTKGLLFVETKRPGQARSPMQFVWHDHLNDQGYRCLTIYLPRDLDKLEAALRG